jgi:hypothetical protein
METTTRYATDDPTITVTLTMRRSEARNLANALDVLGSWDTTDCLNEIDALYAALLADPTAD